MSWRIDHSTRRQLISAPAGRDQGINSSAPTRTRFPYLVISTMPILFTPLQAR